MCQIYLGYLLLKTSIKWFERNKPQQALGHYNK